LDVDGNGTLAAAAVDGGSSDACGIQSLAVSPNVFNINHLGNQEVELTVTDVNSNSATCTTTIVVKDEIDPDAKCKDATLQLNEIGEVEVSPDDIDNGSADAGGVTLSIVDGPITFTCDDVEESDPETVNLRVIDGSNYESICTSTITVEDNVDPEAKCNESATVTLDVDGNGTLMMAQVNNASQDDCGLKAEDGLVLSKTSFECGEVGSHIVTLTVTDVNNNTKTCTSTVTVEDGEDPMVTCKDHTIVLDADGKASLSADDIKESASDNCGNVEVSIHEDDQAYECSDVGTSGQSRSI
jgi:hypothetical protein